MENTFYKKYLIKDGLVEYKKDNETLLIEKPILDKSIKTIINKPVIITHDGENKVGEVVDAYYDIDTGNYIVGFNIWNEEAKKLLNNGYSISSTFEVINKEPATEKYHNIEYDNRVIDLEFINIAIVKEPRYQEAKQYVNSLDQDNIYENGGAGSGNWGHKGRKGLVGGSSKYSSEDYSEKDLSEIAKRKETKGIINKKSIIKETIKNKVMNKLKKDKDLKERVEKFRKENFEKKETEKKEDIEEKDEVKYLKEEYKKLDKEIDEIEDKIKKNREERQEIEKEFDKIPEATMTNFWVRNDIGREIQHRLSAKEEESKEMIHKSVELREKQYQISEKIKEIEQREREKQKQEAQENYSYLQRDLDIKNFLQEKAINGYSMFKIANTIKSIEEKLQDKSIFAYNRKQKKQAEQDLKELKDFVNSNKYIELREEFKKKFGEKDIDFYLDYKQVVDNKNNQNLNNLSLQEKEKLANDLTVKHSEYQKGDAKRNRYKIADTMEDLDKAQKGNYTLLKRTNRGAQLIEKDGKVAWLQKRMIREDGSLTKAGQEAINNGKTKEQYENEQKTITTSKQQANKQYKEKYNYDIDNDKSIKSFVDMKKKAILKYGDNENVKSILNREFTEKDIPQNLLNYVKNSNGRLEANYWEGGDKKRIYFNVFDNNNKKVYFTTNTYKDLDKLDNGFTKEEIEKQRQTIKDLEKNKKKIINSWVADIMEDLDFSEYRHPIRSQRKAERTVKDEQEERFEDWIKNEKEKLEHMENNM